MEYFVLGSSFWRKGPLSLIRFCIQETNSLLRVVSSLSWGPPLSSALSRTSGGLLVINACPEWWLLTYVTVLCCIIWLLWSLTWKPDSLPLDVWGYEYHEFLAIQNSFCLQWTVLTLQLTSCMILIQSLKAIKVCWSGSRWLWTR